MRRTRVLVGIAIGSCGASLSPANAQSPAAMDEIIVSANRFPTEYARIGSSVEVITEEQLAEHGQSFLKSYLEQVAGLYFTQNGPPGSESTLSMRGAYQRYVILRIDGLEVSDPSGAQIAPDFPSLLSGGVSRVEILKGSQSTLYGGEAVAGVVDITTKQASRAGWEQDLALETGAYGSTRVGYSLLGGSERGNFAAGLQRFESDGFSAMDEKDGNTEADGYENTTVTASKSLILSDRVRLEGSLRYTDVWVEFDDFGGDDRFGNHDEREQIGTRLAASLESPDGRLRQAVSAQHYAAHRETFGAFPNTFEGQRNKLEYLGSWSGRTLGFVFGADWTEERATTSLGVDETASIAGAFGQVAFEPIEGLSLTASARHDRHSEFAGHTTWRFTGAYGIDRETKLRASAGTGFRAPSNSELFSPDTGFGPVGNPDLEPEESRSIDIGIDRSFGGGSARLSATLFQLDTARLIQFVFGVGNTQVPGTTKRRGVELAGSITPSDWASLSLRYTYTHTAREDGSRLIRVPVRDIGWSASIKPAPKLTLQISGQHAHDTLDTDFGAFPSVDVRLKDYNLVHVKLGIAVSERGELYARVENLLDEEYQTVLGFGTSDRAGYVGFHTTF